MSQSTGRRPSFELVRLEDPSGVSLAKLPGRHQHHRYVGHVYVIELSNGTVKVGMTANPFERISKHAANAAPYGFHIVRLWVSIAHRNAPEVEKLILAQARKTRSERVREEYFRDLDFAELVRFANGVGYQRIDPEEIAELIRAEGSAKPFGEVSLTPVDPFVAAQERIAAVFGRRSDGTYDIPVLFRVESAEDLQSVITNIAEAKGCPIEDVLDMTWLDMLEETVTRIVRTEAMKLQSYAITSGQMGILETTGESMARISEDGCRAQS